MAVRELASWHRMNRRFLFFLTVAIVAAALAIGIMRDRHEPSTQIDFTPGSTDPTASGVGKSSEANVETDSGNSGHEECLNPAQLRTDPIIIAEYDRLSAVADKGPYFESYRGLDVATLTGMADAGDSAAMVLLGAHAELRAHNKDDLHAPDLVSRNKNLLSFRRGDLTDESRLAYIEAADWYYKAALHGRVMALHRYGQLIHLVKGDAVAMGWISKEEFELMDKNEQNFLHPFNAYNIVAHELVPEILSGPWTDIRLLLPKGTERTWPVVDSLMDQYFADLEKAGLSLVKIDTSTLPPLDDLNYLLCPGYDLDRVFDQ